MNQTEISDMLIWEIEFSRYKLNDLEEQARESNDPKGLLVDNQDFICALWGDGLTSIRGAPDNYHEISTTTSSGYKFRTLAPEKSLCYVISKPIRHQEPIPLLKRFVNYLRTLAV